MTSQVKKLRDISSAKNIPTPSYHGAGCAHCPLHTARKITKRIKDSVTLVLGIAECACYVKGGDTLFNVVLDWHDVTFGCKDKLAAAFDELMQEYEPKAVFIITTCVPEITGDDVDSLAAVFQSRYGIAVAVVHTEHFKTVQESAGVQNAMAACIEMMKVTEKDASVNILGQGQQDFLDTELSDVLKAAGVEPGIYIPDCSVAELERASKAKLNIVVDSNALLLAQKMEQRFHIPYVSFEACISPQGILEAYRHLFCRLEKPMPEMVITAYEKARKAILDIEKTVSGTSYFCERTQFPTFALNAFLCELGMMPQLIVTPEFPGRDSADLMTVLQYSDPYIAQRISQETMQALQDELKPDLLIGGRRGGRGGRSGGRGNGGSRGRYGSKRIGFDAIIEFVSSISGNQSGTAIKKRHSPDARSKRREGRRFS